MFKQIFLFELKLWLKKPITYIFFVVFFGLSMLITAAVAGLIGNSSETNAIINSASSIAEVVSVLNTKIIGLIILITIIAPVVYKDFQYNMHPLLFTKPISKFGYLFGRFAAVFLVALFVLFGSVLGHIITCALPGIEADRLGSFKLMNYIQPFIYFIIPNTFFIGAIFFSLVTFSRNMLSAYIGAIVLLVLKGISPALLSNVENEILAAMLDPFGGEAFKAVTKYWSTEEQNTLPIQFSGMLMYNRLLWLGISMFITVFTYFRFQFSQFNNPVPFFSFRKKKEIKSIPSSPVLSIADIPKANQVFSVKFSLYQVFFLSKFEFLKIVKSIFFIIIIILCALTLTLSTAVFGELYGTPTYMVTYQKIGRAHV